MFRSIKLAGGLRGPKGARFASYDKLKINVKPEWHKNDPALRLKLLSAIDATQWEARGLDSTAVTVLNITSSGIHTTPSDPVDHFTARAFDDNQDAVWFYDTKDKYYTNGIHFYETGLPTGLDVDRFVEVPSTDPGLIAWTQANNFDIKTGKKI